jgi:hypothetical protein
MHGLDLAQDITRSAHTGLMAFQLHPSIPAGDMDIERLPQLAQQIRILLGREGLKQLGRFVLDGFGRHSGKDE